MTGHEVTPGFELVDADLEHVVAGKTGGILAITLVGIGFVETVASHIANRRVPV